MGRKANPLSSRAKLDLISPCPFVKISPPAKIIKCFFILNFIYSADFLNKNKNSYLQKKKEGRQKKYVVYYFPTSLLRTPISRGGE